MAHAVESQVVLQTHNFNMAPAEMATATLSRLEDFLYDVRGKDSQPVYDGGFQITPTRAIMAGVRTRRAAEYLGLVEESLAWDPEQPIFSSGEQSWSRGVVGGAKFLLQDRGYNGVVQFGGGLINQEQRASLGGLARLQKMHPDGQMPVVVYGGQWRTGGIAEFEGHKFGCVSTQLHPELIQDMWGLNLSDPAAYEQIPTRLSDQGIDEVTLDPVHLWRQHNHMFGARMNHTRILEVIRDKDVHVSDFHVGLARTDRLGTDCDRSMQEMESIVKGPEAFATTLSGEILAAGVEIWQAQNAGNPDAKMRAVAEMPHDGLEALGLAGSKQAEYGTNRVVAHNLRSFLEGVLASAKARNSSAS